jgi:mono/diheme cytochrome c family protein
MRFARESTGPTLAAVAILLHAAATTHADESSHRRFVRQVLPVLKAKCFACHGDKPDQIEGKFNATSRQGLLRGGESGEPAVVPGKPEESQLYKAIRWDGLEMPPKENDRLTAEQIEAIRQWIAAGAPWPDEAAQKRLLAEDWSGDAGGIRVATSGGLTEEWTNRGYKPEQLWAYQPLAKPAVPAIEGAAHPIDAFLQKRREQLGITPAPLADRRTLIRRVTYDLTGLPPTPEEIDAFVGDPAGDDEAWARLIDRLLASPRYGEQWARRWLDVVRYADSSGLANDYERGSAWRFRDYVIRAINDDKPYDQFIREQIAGDEIDAENPEMLVAVGFLRMGPWELTGMEVPKIARQRFLDDVTDIVGQVFLAHALACARCHDHKFDPVPTRDYYAIQACFATTQPAERPAPFLARENTTGFEERRYLRERLDEHRTVIARLSDKSIAAARAWYKEQELDANQFERVLEEVQRSGKAKNADVYDEVRRRIQRSGAPETQVPPRHAGFSVEDFGQEWIASKGIERLMWELERYEPVALSVYSGRTPQVKSMNTPFRMPADRLTAGELEETAILAAGDPFLPREPVRPGVLSVLAGPPVNDLRYAGRLPQGIVGRRRALADWIASEDNPLTPRVFVNRVWAWHFGRGIAANPSNFGATGKRPTHPELLDWLAATFLERGWSLKSLHRLILTSHAYRRSCEHPRAAELVAKDPDSSSYAVFRPQRLTAEELRDSLLAASGELNLAIGGIPVRPEIHLDVALQPRQVMGTFAPAWQPSPLPSQRHRRSIYVLKLRGLRDPAMEVFNEPNPDLSCEAREASTVTPQVLALFNSRSSYERALALAARVLRETQRNAVNGVAREARPPLREGEGANGRGQPDIDTAGQASSATQAIDRAFVLCFGRQPTGEERSLALEHWARMTARHEKLTFASPQRATEVVREAVEENTGEKFAFVERLNVMADFVPDLAPHDVDARTRGLAEVCLVLLNANEFIYVY